MKKSLPLATAAALGLLLAGCSASASLTVDPDTVADKALTALKEQVGPTSVEPVLDCGTKNIELKKGNEVTCILTDGTDDSDEYEVTVTITDVDGTSYSINAKVADAAR